ncbi:MAG: class I SAM-dependent methyltransferase [Halobacteriales archaeon]
MDAEAVQRAWVNRTGAYSPDYYAHYGSNETSHRLREALDRTVGADASVLELGCSAGRHLAHLYDHGYRDLWGIDINAEAGTVMRQAYPALAEAGNFTFEAIEDVIDTFEPRQFDAVFSVETLQHIHHDHAWVFAEVARITDRLLITVEIEDTDDPGPEPAVKYIDDDFPLYRRDWGSVFTAFGFDQVDSRSVGRDRMRVFRRRTPETSPSGRS